MPTRRVAKKDSGKPQAILIQPAMLEPISKPGDAGYVPFCTTLHWIMTSGGTRSAAMDDEAAWTTAVDKLLPLICGEDIDLIGLPCGQSLTERIPGHALTLARVQAPYVGNMLFNSPCHIACSPFLDTEYWIREFNDKLYQSGRVFAAWTHLQVPKVAVLSRWPRLQSKETLGNEATANTQHDARPLRPQRRARSRPERERAKSAVAAVYPNGVPNQSAVSNVRLYKAVGDWCQQNGRPDISKDTILRAAGRRK